MIENERNPSWVPLVTLFLPVESVFPRLLTLRARRTACPAGFCFARFQLICFRRLRFMVPSCMLFRVSRLMPVPRATQEIASSAIMV